MLIVNVLHWWTQDFQMHRKENYTLLKFHCVSHQFEPHQCGYTCGKIARNNAWLWSINSLNYWKISFVCLYRISSGHVSHSWWYVVLLKTATEKDTWSEYVLPSDHCVVVWKLIWIVNCLFFLFLMCCACHALNIWHSLTNRCGFLGCSLIIWLSLVRIINLFVIIHMYFQKIKNQIHFLQLNVLEFWISHQLWKTSASLCKCKGISPELSIYSHGNCNFY